MISRNKNELCIGCSSKPSPCRLFSRSVLRINAKKIPARSPIKTNNARVRSSFCENREIVGRVFVDPATHKSTCTPGYGDEETLANDRAVVHIPRYSTSIFTPVNRSGDEHRGGEGRNGDSRGTRRVRSDWPRDLTLCKRTGQLSAVSPFFGFHAHCVQRPQCQRIPHAASVHFRRGCNVLLHRLALVATSLFPRWYFPTLSLVNKTMTNGRRCVCILCDVHCSHLL